MQISIPKLPDDVSDPIKLREFLSAVQKLLEQKQADDNKIVADIPADTKKLFNVTGSAPMYACRAWVNFKGTGTVAIRGSGNVSSITDNGLGDYTVNMTTAMPDINYSYNISVASASYGWNTAPSINTSTGATSVAPTVSAFRFINILYDGSNYTDSAYINVSVFR